MMVTGATIAEEAILRLAGRLPEFPLVPPRKSDQESEDAHNARDTEGDQWRRGFAEREPSIRLRHRCRWRRAAGVRRWPVSRGNHANEPSFGHERIARWRNRNPKAAAVHFRRKSLNVRPRADDLGDEDRLRFSDRHLKSLLSDAAIDVYVHGHIGRKVWHHPAKRCRCLHPARDLGRKGECEVRAIA